MTDDPNREKWSDRLADSVPDAADAVSEVANAGSGCWPDSWGFDGCDFGGCDGCGGLDCGSCMVAFLPFAMLSWWPFGERARRRRQRKKNSGCDGCDGPDCDFCLLSVPFLAFAPFAAGTAVAGSSPAGPMAGRPLVPRSEPTRPARFGLAAIRMYQRRISPHLPTRCRYTPSCSAYGAQAVRRYGLGDGIALTGARIRRCTPGVERGTADPVP